MRKSIVVAAAILGLTAGSAWAAGPPSVTFDPTQFNIQLGGDYLATAGTLEKGDSRAMGSVLPGNGPTVTVSGTDNQNASSGAKFQFEIFGPAGYAVPIIIHSAYDADISGGGIVAGGLYLSVFNDPGVYQYQFYCSASNSAQCGSETETLHVNAGTGFLYTIGIVTGGGVLGTGSYHSSVDPIVEIDPTWTPPEGYTLADFTLGGSPDVFAALTGGGEDAVPEPGEWALLLMSFAGLGVAARWRRSATLQAA